MSQLLEYVTGKPEKINVFCEKSAHPIVFSLFGQNLVLSLCEVVIIKYHRTTFNQLQP